MKTTSRRLGNYIEENDYHFHRDFFIMLVFFICYLSDANAKSNYSINEDIAIKILSRSDFGNSITNKTRLFKIYQNKNNFLFYYVSNSWKEDHPNEGLVVFKDKKYSHDYYINQTCNFKIDQEHLICYFVDFPGEIETNLLSDVFAGKKIVIGGSDERPWRGSRHFDR